MNSPSLARAFLQPIVYRLAHPKRGSPSQVILLQLIGPAAPNLRRFSRRRLWFWWLRFLLQRWQEHGFRFLLSLPFPFNFSANGFQQSAQMSYSLLSISFCEQPLAWPAWPHKSQRITALPPRLHHSASDVWAGGCSWRRSPCVARKAIANALWRFLPPTPAFLQSQ